ncbi:hypothetical protein [Proteus hauseri]|uniref:hypothetical protein n=1 Tax=Proteus hauseri TaxID=183417 RepID=UPI0032DADEC1
MKKGMVLKTVLGIMLLFPLYSQAITLSAYLEVKQLLVQKKTSEEFKSTTQAYLNGIANGFNFYAVSVKIHNQGTDFKPLYCPPAKTVQNADFMIEHVDNYLEKYPLVKQKQADSPIELIYIQALQDVYPCKD